MNRDQGVLFMRDQYAGLAVSRRSFVRTCMMAAAAVGLTGSSAAKVVAAISSGRKPSVIWLHFQECTGCSMSLLRPSHPELADLILDLISLDYHETLFAAAGHQAEAALKTAMDQNDGKYICVIEGAIPTKDGGIYCKIGDRTALEIARDVSSRAAAVIATGSCASWGGLPSSGPNPTGAVGAHEVIEHKAVINLPGCPANPYVLLGTVLQYATLGTLPALDELGRPKFAYGRTIHEHCPRRAHFDAGRFAEAFGDEGHQLGYCLYKLGCKGPATHASCSVLQFCEVTDAWPIGIGHPCFGCTEQSIAFNVPLHQTVAIERPAPPDTYPPINPNQGAISPVATGVAGVVVGALLGAGYVAAKKFGGVDSPGANEDTGEKS
ncbi:MAG TPA: hydrogenase small subunit [Verrucomicrobiae bacterium]|nr:hydrogenase small subunit [Verrucomicrobiae bacterium]